MCSSIWWDLNSFHNLPVCSSHCFLLVIQYVLILHYQLLKKLVFVGNMNGVSCICSFQLKSCFRPHIDSSLPAPGKLFRYWLWPFSVKTIEERGQLWTDISHCHTIIFILGCRAGRCCLKIKSLILSYHIQFSFLIDYFKLQKTKELLFEYVVFNSNKHEFPY